MNIQGRLAQSVRAPASHAGGQRFESSIAHHATGLNGLDEHNAGDKCRSGGMADALRSGRSIRKGVWVQIPPSAPTS